MRNFFKKSAAMSLPETQTIHGVEIKKVPVGQYIRAMKQMEDLPRIIVEECFSGKSMADVIALMANANEAVVVSLLGKLLIVLPEHLVKALCSIIGLDVETALDKLTPKELFDVVKAYWELNEMSDFFDNVSGLIKAKLPTLISGYKNGLQSVNQSESQNTAS